MRVLNDLRFLIPMAKEGWELGLLRVVVSRYQKEHCSLADASCVITPVLHTGGPKFNSPLEYSLTDEINWAIKRAEGGRGTGDIE